MRIISGLYGGRKLSVPKDKNIRPTSDKIRGSIFNSLNSKIDIQGIHCLDLFAGTGALGLEALSRGAGFCKFFDMHMDSLKLAQKNAHNLMDQSDYSQKTTFKKADSTKLSLNKDKNLVFDLFFCDPPYNKALITPVLEALTHGLWLKQGAVGVLESEKKWESDIPTHFEMLNEKIYGDTKITYIRLTP